MTAGTMVFRLLCQAMMVVCWNHDERFFSLSFNWEIHFDNRPPCRFHRAFGCARPWELPNRSTPFSFVVPKGKRRRRRTVVVFSGESTDDDGKGKDEKDSLTVFSVETAEPEGRLWLGWGWEKKNLWEDRDLDSDQDLDLDLVRLPPIPSNVSNDDGFRAFRRRVPVFVQNGIRDTGFGRFVVDWVSTPLAALAAARAHPLWLPRLWELSRRRRRLSYGSHPQQVVDWMVTATTTRKTNVDVDVDVDGESQSQSPSTSTSPSTSKGTVVVCHGGAWGSGRPWMYRLCASVFLADGWDVAVLGYRTYPTASTVDEQVDDLARALRVLARNDQGETPTTTTTPRRWAFVGHSSGAHIGMLYVLRVARQRLGLERSTPAASSSVDVNENGDVDANVDVALDAFVGIGGPYDMESHYRYERGRGVDELSPLKPICGSSVRGFRESSVASRLHRLCQDYVSRFAGDNANATAAVSVVGLSSIVPSTLLLHGVEDTVVPYTSSQILAHEFQRRLGRPTSNDTDNDTDNDNDTKPTTNHNTNTDRHRVSALLVDDVGHVEPILNLMEGTGDTTRDILTWINRVTD